jgi:hypothetical protein
MADLIYVVSMRGLLRPAGLLYSGHLQLSTNSNLLRQGCYRAQHCVFGDELRQVLTPGFADCA